MPPAVFVLARINGGPWLPGLSREGDDGIREIEVDADQHGEKRINADKNKLNTNQL